MLRFSLLLTAVALAIGSTGCTHCDTCDDFPIPCVGGNCGPAVGGPGPAFGTFAGAPAPAAPYASTVAPLPPATPSPFATSAPMDGAALSPITSDPTPPTTPAPAPAPASAKPSILDLPRSKPAAPAGGNAPDSIPAPKPGDGAAAIPPVPLGPEGSPGGAF